jgi:polyisoprenoid-binding protein YceI
MHRVLQAVSLLILALPVSLHAQQILALDPAHSQIRFSVDTTLHTVHGTFMLKQGELTFDPATATTSGAITVDALSGHSGDSARDHRMSNEILKASTYNTIIFTPATFTGTFNPAGDSALQIHGTFTLLGKPHEIDVPMKVHVAGEQLQAIGSFAVPYVQWGLKDPSTLMLRVNKEVQIDLSLNGTLHHE